MRNAQAEGLSLAPPGAPSTTMKPWTAAARSMDGGDDHSGNRHLSVLGSPADHGRTTGVGRKRPVRFGAPARCKRTFLIASRPAAGASSASAPSAAPAQPSALPVQPTMLDASGSGSAAVGSSLTQPTIAYIQAQITALVPSQYASAVLAQFSAARSPSNAAGIPAQPTAGGAMQTLMVSNQLTDFVASMTKPSM